MAICKISISGIVKYDRLLCSSATLPRSLQDPEHFFEHHRPGSFWTKCGEETLQQEDHMEQRKPILLCLPSRLEAERKQVPMRRKLVLLSPKGGEFLHWFRNYYEPFG